jgi:hypothetical protein
MEVPEFQVRHLRGGIERSTIEIGIEDRHPRNGESIFSPGASIETQVLPKVEKDARLS